MRILALLVLVLAAAAGVAHAQSSASSLSSALVATQDNGIAGFRFTATQAGLNKFLQVLLPLINQQFKNIQLPDIHMDEHVPVVGKVRIDITNIWIRDFNIPHGIVLTSAPDDVFFEIGPGIHLHFSADFHYRKDHWPHISGHGSVEATPDGGDIKIKIAITPTADGHFHVHVDAASCNFHSFNIKFHGGLAWIVNIFVRLMKEKIKTAIDDAVAKQLHTLVDTNMNAILSKVPTSYPVGSGAGAFIVNIPLVQSVANNNWLDLGFAMTVNNARGGARCPHPIPDIPQVDTSSTSRMLQLFMGQHLFNCAFWVQYVNGALDQTVVSNTTNWALIIPAMWAKWPNSKIDMHVTAKQQGEMKMSTTGVTANFDIKLNLTVFPIPQPATHACALDVAAAVTFKMWIANDAQKKPHLYLNVASINLQYGVIDSAVGTIDLSLLQALTSFVAPIITKAIDELLKDGFPIPVHKGLDLIRDEILFFNGYVLVEADFQYTSLPPTIAPPASIDMSTPDVIHIDV